MKTCSNLFPLQFFHIERVSFDRLLTEDRTSIEKISLPATSVHQHDTLTMHFFVLDTYFELFFATGLCQLGNQQLCITFCLHQTFAQVVKFWLTQFYSTHFVVQSDYLVFLIHNVFVCIFAMSETESSLKETQNIMLYMQIFSKSNEIMSSIFSDQTPCAMNAWDCISYCRLELAFLYHKKHSLTYVLSAEYMSN